MAEPGDGRMVKKRLDLVEQIVVEIRRKRALIELIPETGRLIIHLNRCSRKPVEVELSFKA